MPNIDWPALFIVSVHPLEVVVRGSIIYWFLFLVFRFVLRRDAGSVAMTDVLLLVLIADAAQNAMAGEYKSITDGALLIATLVSWNVFLDWLVFHSPLLERILQPPKLKLVDNGEMLRRNMRREFITDEELMSKLREHGVSQLAEVKRAYMESDGSISVVKREASVL